MQPAAVRIATSTNRDGSKRSRKIISPFSGKDGGTLEKGKKGH